MLFVQSCFLELSTLANDRQILGDFYSQAEMSVSVQKCGCMIETLWHYNLGPNVLFETRNQTYVYICGRMIKHKDYNNNYVFTAVGPAIPLARMTQNPLSIELLHVATAHVATRTVRTASLI